MLGGLALKRRWQKRRAAEGKPTDRPNLVMGINVQVCWEKFANYWDVEMRLVPMEGDRFHLSAEEAVKQCDENTIGVVAILGSTFDGSYEPVAEICAALDALEQDTGLDVPVHVDGASGAMIAPFLDPDLVWDFRLPRVASINTSGHKYGLVYPGVGWVVWRDADALPEDLIFWVNYLGDNMPTFALNFSRPGAQVVAQYYNFIRLGFEGYRKVQGYARDVATGLADRIAEVGPFRLLTRGDELPVFAFTLEDGVDNFTVFDVSNAMRERGWQVPAYTFPENRTDLAALRVVVRRGFTHDMADMLVERPRAAAAAAPAPAGAGARRRGGNRVRPLTGAVWKDRPSDVSTGDHHSVYLAKAVAALTPEGRERVDELLEQLVEVAGGRELLVRFAAARKSEADLGRTDVAPEPDPGRPLTEQELNALLGGFLRIRDQEHLDDVADWANAVIALLEDELHAARDDPR